MVFAGADGDEDHDGNVDGDDNGAGGGDYDGDEAGDDEQSGCDPPDPSAIPTLFGSDPQNSNSDNAATFDSILNSPLMRVSRSLSSS
ncbi:hypothetical protein L1049_027145 [Liquidambar formosana]|uniref:Uncharacterized protein n=1 Tax=Liquidambar formosana TaxID=63359 RepID=A0AAP0N7R5_LIQFO